MSNIARAAVVVVALLLAVTVRAQGNIPANDGWVTDLGEMLTAEQESSLEALMESYRSGTTHEIALLTVADLDGQPIERFALEVGRAWGVGGKEADNGALLVVSREDRKIRIEVGGGLEGNLTDSISGRIIRDVIAPRFKRGDYYEGMHEGILAMHAAIGGDYGPIQRSGGGKSAAGALSGCFSSIVFLIFLFAIMGGGRRRGIGGVLPWIILGSMASGHRGGGVSGGGLGGGGGFGGGGFGGFGGGGGFSGGGASGGW